MAGSIHAFVRGSTALFYEWLALSKIPLPTGPALWICGDCHVGNLGPVGDTHGAIDVEIRDLDQSVIGNPVHDLVRLGLSLSTAARSSRLPGATTVEMLEVLIAGYGAGLTGSADDVGTPDAVMELEDQALGRTWRKLAKERLEGDRVEFPKSKRFDALDKRERRAVEALARDLPLDVLLGQPSSRVIKSGLLDAAFWRKGCSSLGLLRYALLLECDAAGEEPERLVLLDVKEATAPLAPALPGTAMPQDPAERVLAGARALSPFLGHRMFATRLLDTPVFVRELKPQDLKLDLEQFSRPEAMRAARYLAFVVGRAHGRQLDGAARGEWAGGVMRNARALIAAIAELLGRHEAAYLEHCAALRADH